MSASTTTPAPKRSSATLAIVLLAAGLLVGGGIGYVLPRGPPPTPSNVLSITGSSVYVSVLAGPGGQFDWSVGGLTNPTIEIERGANVTVYFRNIDPTVPHSWTLVAQGPPYAAEAPEDIAFPGAATPMHHMGTPSGGNETVTFTASSAGTYWYLCHVAGHAAAGMFGQLTVKA